MFQIFSTLTEADLPDNSRRYLSISCHKASGVLGYVWIEMPEVGRFDYTVLEPDLRAAPIVYPVEF